MPKINRKKYKAADQDRFDAEMAKLLKNLMFPPQNPAEFKQAITAAAASNFPVNWPNQSGLTLLHFAAGLPSAARAGLLLILINAGADIKSTDESGATPLDVASLQFIKSGDPIFLKICDTLLTAGSPCGLNPRGNEGQRDPVHEERRRQIEAHIATWDERRAASDRAQDASTAFDYAL